MKRVLKIIGAILSAFLLIPMFALELLLFANLILNSLISSDNLAETLEQLMTYNRRNNTTLVTIASPNTYGSITASNDKINYSLVENKIKEYLVDAGLSEDEALEIVRDEEIKKIVNNYLESVILNKVKDSKIEYPSKEEVRKIIKKNYPILKKIKMIEEKYPEDKIDEFVDDTYEEMKGTLEEVEDSVNTSEIKELVYFKKFININPLLFILGIIVIIGLIMLFRMSFYKWLVWASIPTLLNGILYSSLGLFGMRIVTSIVNLEDYTDILDPVAKKMSTLMIRYGIVSIIITIIMIVTYSIVKNKLKVKKHK